MGFINCRHILALLVGVCLYNSIGSFAADDIPENSSIPKDAESKEVPLADNRDPTAYEKGPEYSKILIYFKNGVKVGERRWYKNGKIYLEYTYRDGLLNGVARTWDEDGDLDDETEFKNGKRDGALRTYYSNGKIKHLFWFRNGKPHGIAKSWDKDGVSQEIGECYIDGIRVGKYNVDGKAVTREVYVKAALTAASLPRLNDTE